MCPPIGQTKLQQLYLRANVCSADNEHWESVKPGWRMTGAAEHLLNSAVIFLQCQRATVGSNKIVLLTGSPQTHDVPEGVKQSSPFPTGHPLIDLQQPLMSSHSLTFLCHPASTQNGSEVGTHVPSSKYVNPEIHICTSPPGTSLAFNFVSPVFRDEHPQDKEVFSFPLQLLPTA